MIPSTEFIEHWGKRSFMRFTARDLLDVRLPSSSRHFLIDAGLPRRLGGGLREGLGIAIDATHGKLPKLGDYLIAQGASHLGELDLAKYRRFGSSFEGHLCISEVEKGCVLRIDRDAQGRLMRDFVNSNIERFVAFLFLVEKFTEGCKGLNPEEQKRFVQNEERKFRKVDRKALDHWWGAIFMEWKASVS